MENVIKSCDTNKLSQKTKKYCQEVCKNIFDLFEELQTQSNNLEEIDKEANQILNSIPYIVHIADGVATTYEQTIDLNEIFTITYKGIYDSPR